MTKQQELELDAVKMMRSIRDELSRKLKHMPHEEQRRYIQEQLSKPETDQDGMPLRRSSL